MTYNNVFIVTVTMIVDSTTRIQDEGRTRIINVKGSVF